MLSRAFYKAFGGFAELKSTRTSMSTTSGID